MLCFRHLALTTVASRQGQGQSQGHAQGHRHPPNTKAAASYNFSGNLQGYIIRKLKQSREFAKEILNNNYKILKTFQHYMVSITRIIKEYIHIKRKILTYVSYVYVKKYLRWR